MTGVGVMTGIGVVGGWVGVTLTVRPVKRKKNPANLNIFNATEERKEGRK